MGHPPAHEHLETNDKCTQNPEIYRLSSFGDFCLFSVDFLVIPLPVETTTNCPVCIWRALLQYFLWYRELQATDVLFRQFIFAAAARFTSRHLDDHQLQLLFSAQKNREGKRILNSPR